MSSPSVSKKNFDCRCGRPNTQRSMIRCHNCRKWSHFRCYGLVHAMALNYDKWFCRACQDGHGLFSTLKSTLGSTAASDTAATPSTDSPFLADNESSEASVSPRLQIDDESISPSNDNVQINDMGQQDSDSSTVDGDTDDDVEEVLSEVEDILDNAIVPIYSERRLRRRFMIRWKSTKTTQWLWEEDLVGCENLLPLYLRCKNLSPTKLQFSTKVGASPSARNLFNISNWPEFIEVVKQSEIMSKRKGFFSRLPIKVFDGMLGTEDSVYLVRLRTHVYVVLYYYEKKKCFICDGGNVYLTDPEERRLINHQLGAVDIAVLPFIQQQGVDHCGSSAACIATEFQRLYSLPFKNWPNTIVAGNWELDRLRSTLHKGKSVSESGWVPISERPKLVCAHCSRGFHISKKKAHGLHERQCKGE